MKKTNQFLLAVLLFLTPFFVVAQATSIPADQASELVSDFNPDPVVVEPMDFTSVAVYHRGEVLYDNGPFVTHPGAGPGGSDRSTLENVTLGMTTLGSNVSIPNFRMADDFTVPAPGWNLETFKFYGYQTNSTTTSTFDAVNLRIWDGNPSDPGSNIVWGDGATNLFLSTSWTNCYRDQENLAGNTARPIMEVVADVSGLFLPAGTYWVDYQLGGTLASGPWTSPVTILGQTTTGNAMHFGTAGWIPWLMGGTSTPQGALFKITGTVAASGTTVTIGEGTLSQYQVPWNHYYQYSRTQTIYLQTEIGTPGAITKIAYNADTWPASYTYNQVLIWMGHTTLSSFATAADWVDNATLTLVYDGPVAIAGPGWFEIELDVPFLYDNTSNLILSIHDPLNIPSYAGFNYRCFYSTPGGNRFLHAYSDTQVWPPTVFVSNMMPNIQLTLEEVGEGFISGVVSNAVTGNPLIGAHVWVGGEHFITLADGAYSFQVNSGTHEVTAMKTGYETQVVSVTVAGGETVILDFELMESANVPGPVLAELNAAATAVNISWGLPQGLYEIIYDDGIADNVTAWGLGGNMNALRFTPAGYPAKIVAGSVNIYDGTYPPNGNPLVPFQMAVYDATGPNSYPGNELGVVTVTPADFGWVYFEFDENIVINSGDFYLVMIQGGNFPNCAPIAIDQTNPVMRSYSRFATGGAPWTPAGFNDFMMRAIVDGPGGPGMLAYSSDELLESVRISQHAKFLNHPPQVVAPVGAGIYMPIAGTGTPDRAAIGYNVYQLVEGDEGDKLLWTMLGSPTGTTFVDNTWPSLDDGAYRWAVKAKYPLDVLSEPTFSNVLRKNWASNVTINVTLSDPNVSPAGIQVGLQNTVFPQYAYNGTTNSDGVVNFPEVWKGNYNLVIYKFGYTLYEANIDIMTNTFVKNVMLLEIPYPPSALYVDPITLLATWVPPGVSLDLLEENWSSGSFATNEWTFQPSQGNWAVNTFTGNPAPSAQFNWSPSIMNYSHALVSKQLSGLGMPNVKLKYDIFLSNFSTATVEQMAVEVWNGSTWVLVANYTNSGGSIPWTTHTHDITAHAQGQQFRVRFRAHGADSWNINNWNVDNIMIYGEVADGGNRGVLGYFVSLDGVDYGFTTETTFRLPLDVVNYGQTYLAGVRALYESGFSPPATYMFTSQFLFPPCDLEGEDVGHAVTLTWSAPGTCNPFGDRNLDVELWYAASKLVEKNEFSEYSPVSGSYEPQGDRALFDLLASWPVGVGGGEYSVATDGQFMYTAAWNSANFYRYTLTGTYLESFTIPGAGSLRDLTYDGQFFYGAPNTTTIYQMNFTTQTLVGTITAPAAVRGIAYDADNDGFWVTNGWNPPIRLISRTGAVLQTVNSVAASLSGLGWEKVSDGTPYLWAYTQPASNNILVKIDIATGATLQTLDVASVVSFAPGSISGGMDITNLLIPGKWVFLGTAQNDLIWVLELADDTGTGPGAPVETAGFRIYRNGEFLVEVDGETFSYTDDSYPGYDYLPAGTYSYKITAIYEHGDEIVESLPEGPISVTVAPGLGFINGLVYNCVTFQPVGGVTVTAGEFSTVTLPNGTFTLVCHEGVYDIHFTRPFYFETIVENVTVLWQQTITVNACVTPFQIFVDPTQIDEVLPPGGQSTHTVVVTNTSADELNWSVSVNYLEDRGQQQDIMFEYVGPQTTTCLISEYSPDKYNVTGEPSRDLFDLLYYFPVGVGGGEYSVATDGNYIYTAAWNSANFYKYQLDGTYLNSFTIPGAGNIRDLTYDGEYFYGAPNTTTIYKMNFAAQTLAGTITAPAAVRGIAYDALDDGFWVTNGWNPPIRLISRTGAVLKTLNTTAASFSGLGWENVSPGGPYLWAYTQPASDNILVKIDISTGATLQTFNVATVVPFAPGSISGGMDITNKLVPGKWVFLGTAQNDVIWVLELADAANWLVIEPTSGTLAPGANANVAFNFITTDLELNDYKQAIVTVNTNPNVGSVPVNVSLLIEGDPPTINVNPTSMWAAINQGGITTQPLTISNLGDGVLSWEAHVVLDEAILEATDYSKFYGSGQFESLTSAPVIGEASGFQAISERNEIEIHYDTDWANNSVGTGGAVSFMCAARFTPAELGNYYGSYEITKARIHIAQANYSNVTVKIWKGGQMGNPGTEVYSRNVTGEINVAAWTTINLTAPVALEAGQEYWIGYAIDATGGHPASVDAGPMVAGKGAWMFFNGVWSQLTELAPTLNYNWCIRGVIAPIPTPWLTINPTSGDVVGGGSGTIIVTYDATDLAMGTYEADIVINSNDPVNPTVVVPVFLDVGVGIGELEKITMMVYPVPASDLLNVVVSEGIRQIRMLSYTGQIVYNRTVSGEQTMQIDVKPFHTGAYIMQFINQDGQTFNRRILINR